jgi:hypothetical protein
MGRIPLRGAAIIVTLALLGTAAIAGGYLQTFDGAPPVPTSFRPLNNFDVAVHVNDNSFTPVNAGHGAGCEAPPAVHVVTRFEDAVYQCKDHLMTALWAHGYGVIYLTPNQLADFSGGETVIKLDVSTQRTSDRDWWDIWVTPYADHLELPLDAWLPDLNGEPRNAVHVRMDNFGTGTGFRGGVVRNFKVEDLPNAKIDPYESVLTTSASVRTGFEMHLTRTHVKFGIPSLNLWWLDSDFADLGWTSGVVQIGHHSYNPDKNGGANQPDTWHWDNIGISPSIPFTILESDRRAADATAPLLTFAAPAPANSNLRFNARGSNIQVSYNAGVTWQAAQRAAVVKPDQDEVFKSYWTPMPAGAATVMYRGSNWCCGPWEIRDASIFSLAPSSIPAVPAAAPVRAAVPGAPQPGAPQPSLPSSDAYHAAWVDQSAYPTLLPGESADITMHFRNTGSATWVRGSLGAQANLGINGDDRSLSSIGIGWPTPDRPAIQAETTVAPDGIGTFRFTLRAPATPGTYAVHLRPVIDGLTWMEDQGVYMVITVDLGFHSSWAGQSDYPVLRPNEVSGPLTISFTNRGTRPWVQGAAQQANLGINGDDQSWADLGIDWPTADRPARQAQAVVAPGTVGSFSFRIKAPSTPGVYAIHLRPVIDGLTWMDDDGVFLYITVTP